MDGRNTVYSAALVEGAATSGDVGALVDEVHGLVICGNHVPGKSLSLDFVLGLKDVAVWFPSVPAI
jgi:hypothetical protein